MSNNLFVSEKSSKISLVLKSFAFVIFAFVLYWKFNYTPNKELQSIEIFDSAGNKINFDKKSPTIISFYQSWCSDCVRETPVLDSFARLHGVQLFLVSDESEKKRARFQSRFPTITSFVVSKKPLASEGIKKYPTVYFYDKKGALLFKKLEVVSKEDLDKFYTAIQ